MKPLLRLISYVRRWSGPFALLLTVGLVGTSLALASTSGSPSVWIDDPLDGTSHLAGVPVPVVGHVADSDGLVGARLEVDGVEIGSSESSIGAGALATLQFEWTPQVPGLHVLGLWMQSTAGEWIGPAMATVVVIGDTETTTTIAPTTTSTSTTSVPPTTAPTTTTPCTFEIPRPTSPADNHVFSKTGIAMSVPFAWAYAGCSPDDLVFHVQLANDPGFFTDAIVWSAATSSQEAASVPIACGDYWWRVRVRAPEVGEWSPVFSFIVQDGCSP